MTVFLCGTTSGSEGAFMSTRRTFLTGAVAGAAMAAVPAAAQRRRAAGSAGELPASIAGLKSMRDQARPITNDERRQRLEKARRLMREQKLDAMFVSWGTSLLYYTGIK